MYYNKHSFGSYYVSDPEMALQNLMNKMASVWGRQLQKQENAGKMMDSGAVSSTGRRRNEEKTPESR